MASVKELKDENHIEVSEVFQARICVRLIHTSSSLDESHIYLNELASTQQPRRMADYVKFKKSKIFLDSLCRHNIVAR